VAARRRGSACARLQAVIGARSDSKRQDARDDEPPHDGSER